MKVSRALLIQFTCSGILIAVAAFAGGSQQAVSALFGSILMTVNIGLLAWAVQQVLSKKSVALAGMVIVIKYLLLAAGLYWMSTQPWIRFAWLGLGVLSTVITAVLYGLTVKH